MKLKAKFLLADGRTHFDYFSAFNWQEIIDRILRSYPEIIWYFIESDVRG